MTPPQKKSGQRIAAWMLLVFGAGMLLLMLMGFAGLSVEPEPDNEGAAAAVIFVFGLPGIVCCVGSILWLRSIRTGELKRLHLYQEKAVLAVAAASGCSVTIGEVARETPLSSLEVEETLSRLCGRSIAHPELLEDGTVLYRFAGLLDDATAY